MGIHDFKVGDTAYFEETWTERIVGGTILEVKMTEATPKHPSEPYLVIQIEGTRYDKRDQLSSKCYPTHEAALDAQKSENERICDEYRARIRNVEDLVRFMYNNNVHNGAEEYTNWNARKVAREKAEELLGLEFES